MKQERYRDDSREILSELMQQPQALKDLSAFYCGEQGHELLAKHSTGGRLLFCGAGSDFYLADLAAQQCCQAGVDARAIEPGELTQWPVSLLAQYSQIFYISPSGNDPEMNFLFEKFEPVRTGALTNNPDGELARRAAFTLPLFAGLEKWLGSKSFLNGGALLWLFSRHLSRRVDGSEAEQLKRLRQRVQLMLDGKEALNEQWQNCLAGADHFIFTGTGLQTLAAAQTELFLAGWAGIHANAIGWSALEQGYTDFSGADCAVIDFQASGNPKEKTEPFWRDMANKEVHCIRVVDGFPQSVTDPQRPTVGLEPGLAVLLNVLSGQLLAALQP